MAGRLSSVPLRGLIGQFSYPVRACTGECFHLNNGGFGLDKVTPRAKESYVISAVELQIIRWKYAPFPQTRARRNLEGVKHLPV